MSGRAGGAPVPHPERHHPAVGGGGVMIALGFSDSPRIVTEATGGFAVED